MPADDTSLKFALMNSGVPAGLADALVARLDTRFVDPAELLANGPSLLLSTGIPFLYPSSGSIGDNGALTGITALPQTYASAYMYFKASAIYAASGGNPAGWYYVVMSSTTAGTIYNNVYSSGVPTVPASPTPFVTTGPGAYTQTVGSDIVAISLPIAAGLMGPRGALRVTQMGAMNNAASNKVISAKIGSTAIGAFTVGTGNAAYRYQHLMSNLSAAVNVSAGINHFGSSINALLRTTIDTSAAMTLNLTLQTTTAATDWVTLEHVLVELLPGA